MGFSERFKELRLKNGLTQIQMAEILDVSKSNISKYEAGSVEPSIETIIKTALHFAVDTDFLLGLTDKPAKDSDLEWRYPPMSNRLGNILVAYRRKEKISETEFARCLNISLQLYIGIENGRYEPSFELLRKIADKTRYDIDYLTGALDHISVLTDKTIDFYGTNVALEEFEGNYHFKARFEELCLQKSIDQDNAEKRLGLDRQAFIDIRQNRMPTLPELLKISYAFGVSMDYLIGKIDIRLSNLNKDELELILNYRNCLDCFKESISQRANDLCLESIREKEASVAADEPLPTGTDNLGK